MFKHSQLLFHQFRVDLSLINTSFRDSFDGALHLALLVFSENDFAKLPRTQLFYKPIFRRDILDFMKASRSLELEEVLSVKDTCVCHDIDLNRFAYYIRKNRS